MAQGAPTPPQFYPGRPHARAGFLSVLRAVSVWTRRLCRSPQYLLAVLFWEKDVSRKSPRDFREESAEKCKVLVRLLAREKLPRLTPKDRDLFSDFEGCAHLCSGLAAAPVEWKGEAMYDIVYYQIIQYNDCVHIVTLSKTYI